MRMIKPTISVLAACLLAAACTSGAQEDPLEPTRGIATESNTAPEFTGISAPYEEPEQPEIRIDTTRLSAEQAADVVIEQLLRSGVVDRHV